MKLLNSDAAAGNGGEPPKAAEIAAGGKSEREALLERQNVKQKTVIKKLADGKRKAEETASIKQREAEQLKQLQQESIAKAGQQPQSEPSKWGFFLE
jgi:hypothetical protein